MLSIRARLCAALTLAALFALPLTPTSSAASYPVVGRILTTYTAAGGADELGGPLGPEVKLVSFSRNTYHQHFTGGTVYWDGSQGGKVWQNGTVPSLSGVSAERDALGRYGFKPGMLYRSAKLCNATTADKRLITAMMHGGLILDLRTSGTCSEPAFPSVVAKQRISIPSHADYVRYVTGSTERTQFGKAIKAIANAPGPVWVHCTAGKDRTGWTIILIMSILGADQGDILAEYLRTSGADEADFFAGLDAVATRYGGDVDGMSWAGMDRYVRDGLGLSQAQIDALRAKFGA